jgi:hypothetical protein
MTMETPKSSPDGVDPSAIIKQLQDVLAGKDNIIANGILYCIHTGTPAEQIIREIKEMAMDSYNSIAGLIGEQLTQTIIKF